MQKRFASVVLGAVTVAVLSGCGAGAATTTPPAATKAAASQPAPAVTTPAPAPAPAAPALSVRGNHVKTVGQSAGIADPLNGNVAVKFTVTKIIVDPKCTSDYPQPAENGHFIEIQETAQVAPGAKSVPFLMAGFAPDYGWTLVTPDGNTSGAATASAAALSCLPQKDLIENTIQPGDKSTGAFVIDVPSTKGTLVFHVIGMDDGWEYQIP
jgi:hypothetical protein